MRSAPGLPLLFVSHEATMTGAPAFLLQLLRWMKERTGVRGEVLLLSGGPLAPEFAGVFPTVAAPFVSGFMPGAQDPSRAAERRRRGEVLQEFEARVRRGEFAAVVLNGIGCTDFAARLAGSPVPVVCYVHELLDAAVDHWVGAPAFRQLLSAATSYVTCSGTARTQLVSRFGVPAERVVSLPSPAFPPVALGGARPCAQDARFQSFVASGAPIVGAAGSIDLRKGADLFVPLALAFAARHPGIPAKFVWIGGGQLPDYDHGLLVDDVAKAGLEDRVHFTGPVFSPGEYFRELDAFVMPSREDAFPLVLLENAALGTPIVCFDRGNGGAEFVREGCGVVVPYLDVAALADAVAALLADRALAASLGSAAARRVGEVHGVDGAAGRIARALVDAAAGGAAVPAGGTHHREELEWRAAPGFS